jgi:molecular chaperone GrpE
MQDERRPAGAPAETPGPAGAPSPDHARPAEDPAAPGGEAEGAVGISSDEAGGEAAAEVQHDLDELLEETKRERDEYLDLARRTKADFENYRKRMSAETASAAKRGKADLASELIGVIDNLERALVAAGIDPAAAMSDATPDEPLAQGIVLTYRELNAVLARAGVEPYDPRGEQFDPAWHEALQTRADEASKPGTVVEVLQKGYRLDGQVIRAARVVVSE